jgi:hypothetical protein
MLFPGIMAQETMKIPDTRTVHIQRGDTLEVASILLRKDKNFVPKRNITYHWFAFNAIHKNQGAFSGYLLHDYYKVFDSENRLIEKGLFSYGIKTGKWLKWNGAGQVECESNWKNGYLDGITNYYKNGKLIRSEQYKKGELHGPVTDYHGSEKKTTSYKNGVLVQKQKDSSEEKTSLFKKWKIRRQNLMANKDTKKQEKQEECVGDGVKKESFTKKNTGE